MAGAGAGGGAAPDGAVPVRAEDDGSVELSGLEKVAAAAGFKAEGNDAFKLRLWDAAAGLYTRAIELTPTNHVLYSNRSAAFLGKGDYGSLHAALGDAVECIRLAPRWPKGYARKGAALHGLKRWDEAIAAYKQGLEADDDSQMLKDGLRAVEQAAEKARKAEQAAQAAASAAALGVIGATGAGAGAAPGEPTASAAATASAAGGAGGAPAPDAPKPEAKSEPVSQMDLDLQELLGVAEAAEKKAQGPLVEESTRKQSKFADQDLGTSAAQIERLLQPFYKFINLNPFEVMMLTPDATDKDIKVRYRDLAALVHPDKNVGNDKARDAFEEVKKAHQQLMNKDRRQLCAALIQQAEEEVKKRRKKAVKKGGVKPTDLPPLEDEIRKETRRMFAEIDQRKQKYEKGMRKEDERVIRKEVERVGNIKKQAREYETFSETRDKRVGNWRQFAAQGKRRRTVKTTTLDKDDLASATVAAAAAKRMRR